MMEKRTVLNAYRAATALSNQATDSMRAALQSVRLKKDLAEGEDIAEEQGSLIQAAADSDPPCSTQDIPEERQAEFNEKNNDLLSEDAETIADDVRPVNLRAFDAAGMTILGSWIEALIEVGAVSEDEAMDFLEELESEDNDD